jgi:hypothetical protein
MRACSALALGLALVACVGVAGCGRSSATSQPNPSAVPSVGQGSPLSLQADVTLRWVNRGEQVQQGTVALTSGGDVCWNVTWTKDTMWRYPAGSHDLMVYSAQTHRLCELYTKANGALEQGGDVEEGLWSPLLAGDHTFFALGLASYAAVVRAAVVDGLRSVPLKTVTFAGRPAWQMEVTHSGQHVTAVVDKASGVLVYGSWATLAGGADRQREEVSLSNLHFGSQLPAATFAPPPAAATLQPSDDYVHFTTVAGAAARVGYPVMRPHWLPSGYSLAAVATRPETAVGPLDWILGATMGGPYVDLAKRPDRETDLVFTDGLRSCWIFTAPIGKATELPQSMAGAAARLPGHVTTRLTHGAFAGKVASTWFDAVSGQVGLTVGNGRFVVLVSGDLAPSEMVRVADSLEAGAP